MHVMKYFYIEWTVLTQYGYTLYLTLLSLFIQSLIQYSSKNSFTYTFLLASARYYALNILEELDTENEVLKSFSPVCLCSFTLPFIYTLCNDSVTIPLITLLIYFIIIYKYLYLYLFV